MAKGGKGRPTDTKETKDTSTSSSGSEAPPKTPARAVQPVATLTSPRWTKKTKRWIVFIVIVIVGVGAFFFFKWRGNMKGEGELLFPPVDLTGTSVVDSISTYFDVMLPYYQEVRIDTLKAGEIIHVRASGLYLWDPNIPAEQGWISPRGVMGEYGRPFCPRDLKKWQRPKQFLLRNSAAASLIGAIGKIEYQVKDGMRVPFVEGTKPFFIGNDAYIVVPKMKETPKFFLALNERWIPGAWQDNAGTCKVAVTLHRP
ncbi:MAG: hypothetical protein V1778_02770 [bacterium]